jgi:DNA-binding transcriptional ArsR family regulator
MRPIHHPDPQNITLEGVLYALGDPVRLEIVKRLAADGELACADLEIPIAKSTLSHHFKILREAGVLYCRKQGTQHMNSLRRDDLEQVFPGLLEAILQATEQSVGNVMLP